MTLKAVLWDMDGTLVDSEPLAIDAFRSAMISQGLTPPDNLVAATTGVSADQLYNWVSTEFGLALSSADWERIKHQGYFKNLDRLQPFKPAVDAWELFQENGIRQAVVSNSDRLIVDANLQHIGLFEPGQITVSRNDVRQGKPFPESYQRAAWLLSVEASEVIVIEDSPSGANAGLAAGMATYFVPYSELEAPKGCQRLESLDELVFLLLNV